LKVTILTLLFFSNIFAQEFHQQRQNKSYIETLGKPGERIIKHIVNTKYDMISIYTDNKFREILLEEVFDQTIIPGVEGREAKVQIKAFGMVNEKFREFLWEINDLGYEVEKYHDYLRLITYGCCSAENTYIYFNKISGNKFLTATSDFAFLDVPNTDNKRIATFHSSNGMLKYDENVRFPDQLGILYYADEKYIIQKLLIIGKLDGLHGTPDMRFKNNKNDTSNLTLWDSNFKNDFEDITGFNIIIDFSHFFKLEIPIKEDKFYIENIELPKQYDIRLIPLGIERIKYLKENQYKNLKNLSKQELRLIRNEIFAHHGHSFKSDDLKKYFNKKIWYKEIPEYKVPKEDLFDKEIEMLKKIKTYELKK